MFDLAFGIEGVEPDRVAAVPILNFKLHVSATGEAAIQSVLLRCQIRIEPARRRYDDADKERLVDLLGTPERWGQTLRPLTWTQTTTVIPAFEGSIVVDLPVPCSSDFSLAAARYFEALQDGDIPLCFLFSGTVFHEEPERGLQVMQISWDREAYFRLPAATYRALEQRHHGDRAWLPVRRDLFERLNRYRRAGNHTSWDEALEMLLAGDLERAAP